MSLIILGLLKFFKTFLTNKAIGMFSGLRCVWRCQVASHETFKIVQRIFRFIQWIFQNRSPILFLLLLLLAWKLSDLDWLNFNARNYYLNITLTMRRECGFQFMLSSFLVARKVVILQNSFLLHYTFYCAWRSTFLAYTIGHFKNVLAKVAFAQIS